MALSVAIVQGKVLMDAVPHGELEDVEVLGEMLRFLLAREDWVDLALLQLLSELLLALLEGVGDQQGKLLVI